MADYQDLKHAGGHISDPDDVQILRPRNALSNYDSISADTIARRAITGFQPAHSISPLCIEDIRGNNPEIESRDERIARFTRICVKQSEFYRIEP